MGISQEDFETEMRKFIDLMNFKIPKATVAALHSRISWADPQALKYALMKMEDESRWDSAKFKKHLNDKNTQLKEEQIAKQKEKDFKVHLRLSQASADCPGGDRCRKCDIVYCNTISIHGFQGIRQVLSGEKTVDEVNADREKKYPMNEAY